VIGEKTVRVTVRFTLDVDPAQWLQVPEEAVSAHQEILVASEVREHARSVVTDLFEDQGWLAGYKV
jgi:hypothetical protein